MLRIAGARNISKMSQPTLGTVAVIGAGKCCLFASLAIMIDLFDRSVRGFYAEDLA